MFTPSHPADHRLASPDGAPRLEHHTTGKPDPVAAAYAALLALHAEGKPTRLMVERDGIRATLEVQHVYTTVSALEGGGVKIVTSMKPPACPEEAQAAPAAVQRSRGRAYSPTEEKIMALMTDDWQTREQLAAKCGLPASSQFSAIMSNLAERECIQSGHRGYRLPQRAKGPAPESACPVPSPAPAEKARKSAPKPARAEKPSPAAPEGCEVNGVLIDDPVLALQVLDTVRMKKRASLGEILGWFNEEDEDGVRVAVQQLAQAKRLSLDKGLYSALEDQE